MPKTDMKLLRDELAESIGVIRRLGEQLRAADKRNAELEMSLAEYTMKYELAAAERDAVAKERDVAVKERDEALAKVERLEDTLQKVVRGQDRGRKGPGVLRQRPRATTPSPSGRSTPKRRPSAKRRTPPDAAAARRAARTRR